uniref:ATP phosphoribosyltransferase n=1 Tax=Lygus hesperus TaxID=30085 RepID=A0A0A9WAA8_LYGHE
MLLRNVPPSIHRALRKHDPQTPPTLRYLYNNRKKIPQGRMLELVTQYVLHRDGFQIYSNVIVKDAWDHSSELDIVAVRVNFLTTLSRRLLRFILSPVAHPIPLRMALLSPYIVVECKQYAVDHTVPLHDISKILTVANLLLVPSYRILCVTTSTYSPRCSSTSNSLTLIDNVQLAAWIISVCSPLQTKILLQILFPTFNASRSSNAKLVQIVQAHTSLPRLYFARLLRYLATVLTIAIPISLYAVVI